MGNLFSKTKKKTIVQSSNIYQPFIDYDNASVSDPNLESVFNNYKNVTHNTYNNSTSTSKGKPVNTNYSVTNYSNNKEQFLLDNVLPTFKLSILDILVLIISVVIFACTIIQSQIVKKQYSDSSFNYR